VYNCVNDVSNAFHNSLLDNIGIKMCQMV